jgi:hypothetical protein
MQLAIVAAVILAALLFANTSWERAKSLQGWNYGFDRKVHHKRRCRGPYKTDCSGFVSYVLGLDHRIGSWEIVKHVNAEQTLLLDETRLRHKSIVAYDSGPQGFDKNRDNGVDHVGVVLRGWDGRLYLCDCKLGYGVRLRPLHEGVLDWNAFALEKKFGTEYMSKFGPLVKTFYVKY